MRNPNSPAGERALERDAELCRLLNVTRQAAEQIVGANFDRWTAGFAPAHGIARATFCYGIGNAVHMALNSHVYADDDRISRPAMRKAFVRAEQSFVRLTAPLVDTSATINAIPAPYWPEAFRQLPLAARVPCEAAAMQAGRLADVMKYTGRTQFPGFVTLVYGLADAFEQATGARATVSYRGKQGGEQVYKGQFFQLVTAVLPPVAEQAQELTGRKFAAPGNVGSAVSKITTKRIRKAKG